MKISSNLTFAKVVNSGKNIHAANALFSGNDNQTKDSISKKLAKDPTTWFVTGGLVGFFIQPTLGVLMSVVGSGIHFIKKRATALTNQTDKPEKPNKV